MISVNLWNENLEDIEFLQQCKRTITDVVEDAEVILFGSRARGDSKKDSDYDIVVIVDCPVDIALEEKIISNMFSLELETGNLFTLIVFSKNQWSSPLYKATPFHKNVEREGVLL